MLKTVDLFCGCGGLSLGFINAGFDIVAAFDNWREAVDIYAKNFNHPVFLKDLTNLYSISKLLKKIKPELIIGGPPCQDFSSAGKRDESLGRANLTRDFAKIVNKIKPRFFVMENVPRILKSRILVEVESIFKKGGYGLTKIVLDASQCGVPQLRKRFFMIGELNGHDSFLSHILNSHLSRKKMTIRDYLGTSLGLKYYYRHPRSYKRRGIFSIDEPSPTIRGCNRPIPKGYPGHPSDKVPISEELRPLTTKERSCIQTFPEQFVFQGSKSALEEMIGNAVPIKLAEYVASCLLEYISNYDRHVLETKTLFDNEGRQIKRKQNHRIETFSTL